MSTDGRSIEEISDAFSPIASGVIKAAAGGMSQGIKDSSLDVWGALVGDPLKMWRTRRLVDGLERVASHIKPALFMQISGNGWCAPESRVESIC